MGMMLPARMNSGITSCGAETSARPPPREVSPVQKFVHATPAGRYTLRVTAFGCRTGLTRNAGPNMYWSQMSLTFGSPRKSMGSARIIV